MSTMCSDIVGSGITLSILCFTHVIKWPRNRLLYQPLSPRTAIVGVRNIYDYPDALLELQETFKRSLNLPQANWEEVKDLSKTFSLSLKL